jgi:hypothetical protein
MTLQPKQIKCLLFTALLLLLMGVFPPWIESLHHRYGVTDWPAGYAPIFRPPAPSDPIPLAGVRLDVPRLVLQWVITCIGSGIVLIWLGSRALLPRRPDDKTLDQGQTGSGMATCNEPGVDAVPNSSDSLGVKWLYWWTYVSLPLGALLGIIFSLNYPLLAIILFPLSIFQIAVASGLHKRHYWAWKWNWLLIVVTWLQMALPSGASTFGTFLFTYPYLMTLCSLIWLWPNYIYWNKRKHLFT